MESKKQQNYNWQDKLEEILADLTDEELWFLERGQAQAGISAYLLLFIAISRPQLKILLSLVA